MATMRSACGATPGPPSSSRAPAPANQGARRRGYKLALHRCCLTLTGVSGQGGAAIEELHQVMPADDPAAPGLAGSQLARPDEFVDRLPGDSQDCRCFVNAVREPLRLRFRLNERCTLDHSLESPASSI